MPQQTTDLSTLRDNISKLPIGDQGFAASLLYQLDHKGALSDRQWYWIKRLAEAAETADVPDFTAEVVQVGEFGGVINLFKTAKKYLKYPKISLQLPDGSPLQLSLAGNGSKAPGTVNLTDGGPFGKNKWYGRVTVDGAWEPAKSGVDPKIKDALVTILVRLATSPARTAGKYGQLTGNCCFCASKLSDERSTSVGYGKTCAQRWGLKWGKSQKTETVTKSPLNALQL